MKHRYYIRLLAVLLSLPILSLGVFGQTQDPACSPVGAVSIRPGQVFFNFGSGIDVRNSSRRTDLIIGQMLVGPATTPENDMAFGSYGQILIPPFAPIVTATQGDLLDRIQLSWVLNPLGPNPTQGFNLYRDGVFLATVASNIRNYNDFNVIAGRPYNYEVRGINVYGEGPSGKALGFQVPNGVVTGQVQTINGSPVPDALVRLTPMQGFSAQFDPTDGAYFSDTVSILPPANGEWTLTLWIKTNSATANAGLLSLSPFPLYLRPQNSASGHEGIEIAASAASTALLSATFPDSTKNGWHHIALSVDATGQGRLYLDKTLIEIGNLPPVPSADELRIGSRTGATGWNGLLDELRIYHSRLEEIDLNDVVQGTASSLTPHLAYYWKMDEEQGTKSFDLIQRHKLYFCGAAFNSDRPPVSTSGLTNEEGFYRIESVSYSTGTTFLAKAYKNFYMYRALRFVRAQADYATLPDFSLTPKATLELWVNSAGPDGTQCLLSKRWNGNDFRLLLKPNGAMNELYFYLNGTEHNFGNLGMGYQHLAFSIDSSGTDRAVTAYKNGVSLGSHSFPGVTGNWSDTSQVWMLGARPSGMTHTDHFGGLLDEIAIYDTTLSIAAILDHSQNPRDMQARGLRVYYSLNEGSGNRLNNSGSVLLNYGTGFGTEWTPFASRQKTAPHVFSPVTRQVTLNPSVTSVDQVDFADRSTVPVTGYVRYKNTDCFARNVEILVNGASFNPQIFTDSTGKFVIDFNPGDNAELSPKFENHQFVPAFWEVTNITSPIAGILFNDITTRKVSGRVAGGKCRKSVIKSPPGMGQGTVCIVKVRSADGCLERQITIDNEEGNYEFPALPPLESLTVAVVEHSDPDVKTAFQVQGGVTINLTQKDTIVPFTYFAPPMVEILSGLDPLPGCTPEIIVLDQYQVLTLTLKMKEQYVANMSDDGVCYIDTAAFHIINGFNDEVADTLMTAGTLQYAFRVGQPNPSPPFLKTLQILGTSQAGREGSLTKQAVVTGVRNKENTFTTMTPEMPTLILRDPPGDGSSAFLEKNEKICKTTFITDSYEVGGGLGVEFHLGAGELIVTAPLGIGNVTDIGFVFDVGAEAQVTYQKTTDSSFQTCTTINQRIATSDGDMIVGGANGADLYMGEAINLVFGFADKVSFDALTCLPEVKTVLNIEPGNFATTYIYSQFYIENYVMNYLEQLAADANTPPADAAQFLESRDRWQAFLNRNDSLKNVATFIRNLSFDAGVSYEYSETFESDTTSSIEQLVNSEESLETHIGYQFKKNGFTFLVKFVSATSKGGSQGDETEKGITTGYVLQDDDPGDAFTVDVAMDSTYLTPVFRLKAGQSSCPWEVGTANREGPNLQLAPGSQFVASNVPANESAVFELILGNLSATNEDWTYGFTAIATNNPHGAVIKLNGQPLTHTQKYIIPYGTSTPITLTIERGPIEYDYDDLRVALFSECEYERNYALSLPLDGDPNFFSYLDLGVHFIRPCSEVNINVPEQNWVLFPDPLTPGPDDLRRITVSGYDTTKADFQLIRVQYRRSDGDGAWINIPGISDRYNPQWAGFAALPDPKPPVLQPGFTQFFWETTGLSDGPYEIRAVAVCSGDASDKPGYSQIIQGRIDREPPSIVGVPQPSDGVFNVGDEISFTFNQPINCDQLIQADLLNANNVGLYDAVTGQLIDANITCYENKIIIDPNFQNKFFENRILRAELHGIQDLTGNVFNGTKFNKGVWEFVVDRNELAWLTDSMGLTKFEGEYKTGTAAIHNRGGSPVPFTITGTPSWMRVVPNKGTLVANQILPVTFEVDSSLAFGLWNDTIILHTETGQNPFFMGGDEPLPIGVRVVCRPPNWKFNPNLYENTMNAVLELNIQGQVSTDIEDIAAAYIHDTLRGYAHIEYAPAVQKYLAYMTVYGNPNDQLDDVRFEIWDASTCLRYGQVVESLPFQPDNVIGTPTAPQVLHTNSLVLREVPLGFGWNWLSFNLVFPDPSLNASLASLHHAESDLMKGQSTFSIYSGGWFGSLNTLSNTTMYIYRADMPDTLKMLGNLLDPATTGIPLGTGWNWIGYVPSYSLTTNEGLSSLPSQPGDLIKSQYAFAQYFDPTFGWVGNLKYMSPPNGYQIKVAAPGTLTYPPPSPHKVADPVESRGPQLPNFWTVNPTQFEYSMTLIGMLKVNGQNATTATMELGVFAGTEVRGSAQAIFIPPLNAYLFFLTSYANAGGEQLKFKLFDSTTGAVQELAETMWFSPDLHQGSIESPVPFTLKTSGLAEVAVEQSFDVQPNPFSTETMFRFALSHAQEVTISVADVNGREVSRLQSLAHAGLNTVTWDGTSDAGLRLGAGVYLVRLNTEDGMVTRRVVLQR